MVPTPSYPLFEHQLYGLALTSKMLEVIEYEQLDLLHVHYAIPHATSAFLAKQILNKNDSDIKVVTTLHGTDITSDGVTAVSRFLKEKTLTNYYINKDIEVIHNFIDTEIYKPSCNTQFKEHIAPNNEKILIHTSNFRAVKRVSDTIRILGEVKKQIPTKLILIGDGPDRSECERLTRELKLEKDVVFLGKQDGL